jgi:hypothetical protein
MASEEPNIHDIPPPRDRPMAVQVMRLGMSPEEFETRMAEFQVDLARVFNSLAEARGDSADIAPDDIGILAIKKAPKDDGEHLL